MIQLKLLTETVFSSFPKRKGSLVGDARASGNRNVHALLPPDALTADETDEAQAQVSTLSSLDRLLPMEVLS